jgi:hypothetical protein
VNNHHPHNSTYNDDPQTDNDSENDQHDHHSSNTNSNTSSDHKKIDEAQRLATLRIRAKRREDRLKEQREVEIKEKRERDKFKRRDEKVSVCGGDMCDKLYLLVLHYVLFLFYFIHSRGRTYCVYFPLYFT